MNIFITGGSSGLGKSIVERLAKQTNNKVWFTFCSHKEDALLLVEQYPNVSALHCDFGEDADMLHLFNSISNLQIDVLINNAYAGYALGKHFHKTSIGDFQKAFEMNIIPTIRITQYILEKFRKQKSGKIITTLTEAIIGKTPTGYSLYSATKAYLAQLVKSWASEYIRYGITSNSVSPSFMLTSLTADTNELMIEQMLANHPLKRLLTTDEVVDVYVFLCDASSQLNGVDIPVNAGINIK